MNADPSRALISLFVMPLHHLDALSHSLHQKGWKIISSRSIEDYPYDYNTWVIERGTTKLEIHFERFGGMGEDVPLERSYGCHVGADQSASLYFGKSPRWESELKGFLQALDRISGMN